MSYKDLHNVNEQFKLMDSTGSGKLERSQVEKHLLKTNPDLTKDEMDFIFNSVDSNNDQVIDYTEFLVAVCYEKLFHSGTNEIDQTQFRLSDNDIQHDLKSVKDSLMCSKKVQVYKTLYKNPNVLIALTKSPILLEAYFSMHGNELSTQDKVKLVKSIIEKNKAYLQCE